MPRKTSGFTLIELLVVITIIVVMLALLTPALDKAIYQAEMAVCMANHGGIAKGASAYAYGYRRHYPYRPSMQNENGQWERIQYGDSASGATGSVKDDRPIMRPFISIDMFLCPLTEPVDYDVDDPNISVLPSTLIWWGGRGVVPVSGSGRHRAMQRVGDRVGWESSTHPGWPDNDSGTIRKWNFNYLTSETDWTRLADEVRAAHPDDEGLLETHVLWKESVWLVFNAVRSRWLRYGNNDRGRISQNYSRADGSVRRIDNIEPHDAEQTVEIREFEEGGDFPNNAEHLPSD